MGGHKSKAMRKNNIGDRTKKYIRRNPCKSSRRTSSLRNTLPNNPLRRPRKRVHKYLDNRNDSRIVRLISSHKTSCNISLNKPSSNRAKAKVNANVVMVAV